MKWQPAPIIGGAYADNARPWSHQDTVNWLPVRTERPGGRSDWKLTPAPGLKAFSTLTNASTDSSDRIRGVRNVEGRLYVVCGQSLFRINGNGTATTIQENAVPGTQRVSMTHNQETGGNTLVITNGYGGWTYNTGTATFAEITDEGFPGFKVCDFLDQYIVGIDPTGRFAFHSELANAGSYNTLDRYEAEAAPDRLVGQVVDHGQWWLFGERTTEIYTNTGAATGTFQRIPGSTIERGLAGTFAVAKLDNSVFWVGDDGVVYRANGYTPVRISTHPIEQQLSQCDLSLAFCMVYEDRGHKILYVTCPDGKTWGYDVATQEWHRRQSYARENWRMESLAKWAGGWYGGDKLTNKLQRVDWGYQDEDGQPLIAERITGILHGNQNRVQVHGIELVLDSGRVPGPVRPPAEIVYPVEIYNPLTAAYLGVAVSHTYLARYGVEPYTFSLDAGSLPTGLSLASTGALTGTPSALGEFAWRVKVTDAIGQTDTLDQGIDLAEGIDGGTEFEVTNATPALITNVRHYEGPRSSLTVDVADLGFDVNVDVLAVSPNGLYAAGVRFNSTDVLEIHKYDTTTGTWSLLAAPATNPDALVAIAWSPDSVYLATARQGVGNKLTVYKRTGDTLTSIAIPTGLGTTDINHVAWDSSGQRLFGGRGNSTTQYFVADFDASTDTFGAATLFGQSGDGTGLFVAPMPGVGSRYMAGIGSAGIVSVWDVTGTPSYAAFALDAGLIAVHWDESYGYLITVGTTGPNYLKHYAFDYSVLGSEALTASGITIDQPPNAPTNRTSGSAVTPDNQYLAVATGVDQYPVIYDLQTVGAVTRLAYPSATGAAVDGVSWSSVSL